MLVESEKQNLLDEKNVIDFTKFMNKVTNLHCETATTYLKAQQFLIKNQEVTDMVSHDDVITIDFLNDDKLKTLHNKYYYNYKLDHDYDLINNIKVEGTTNNFTLTYRIADQYHDCEKIDEFVFGALKHQDIILRIAFIEKPKSDDVIKIYSRKYVMNEYPKKLLREYSVKTKYISYMNGMCYLNSVIAPRITYHYFDTRMLYKITQSSTLK